jgi:hypothetical protein
LAFVFDVDRLFDAVAATATIDDDASTFVEVAYIIT